MNKLSSHGSIVSIGSKSITVKVSAVCATVDLPAKAALLNMTYYNGKFSCITCEIKGEVAKQGRGHAMTFPYNENCRLRSISSVESAMEKGTKAKPVLGFKGSSSICLLESFSITSGMVPDYMHCILLGITKSLLYKWFSSTQSKFEYFVGHSLKTISRRLQSIKPPTLWNDCHGILRSIMGI